MTEQVARTGQNRGPSSGPSHHPLPALVGGCRGVVSAPLTLGLAYEFIRFDHAVVGHMPALVVAVLLDSS